MRRTCGTSAVAYRSGERGNARVKFIIVLTVILLIGYCAYQYVPVAIQSYQLKDAMQQTVNQAALQPTTVEALKKQLQMTLADYSAPPDASITIERRDDRWQATVQYARPVSLPFYTYQYHFDHTVKSFNPAILR
jgi:Flp pilus assembly protein TadG